MEEKKMQDQIVELIFVLTTANAADTVVTVV